MPFGDPKATKVARPGPQHSPNYQHARPTQLANPSSMDALATKKFPENSPSVAEAPTIKQLPPLEHTSSVDRGSSVFKDTQHPPAGGNATPLPRNTKQTMLQMGQKTQQLPKNGPTQSDMGGGAAQGGSPPAASEVSRLGAEQNQVTPWDRPPLGSLPQLQWQPDDHFISFL